MSQWKLAAVQMDSRLGDVPHNLDQMRHRLLDAARNGARLVVFPECVLCGYSFESQEEAWPHAEPLPGPSSEILAGACSELGVWTVYGLLEKDEANGKLFNTCALIGPDG